VVLTVLHGVACITWNCTELRLNCVWCEQLAY